MADLDGLQELLAARPESPRNAERALQRYQMKEFDEFFKSLAELEEKKARDGVALAAGFHGVRHRSEKITGGITSGAVGLVSGVLLGVLDGTTSGISLVAPAVVPALLTIAVMLTIQTLGSDDPFSWKLAGHWFAVALWRGLIALLITVTAIGAYMWLNGHPKKKEDPHEPIQF